MIDFSKLLYLPLDLPPPPNLSESFDTAGPECFFEDSYRNCKHLHIFMNDKKKGKSEYTTFGKSVPSLMDWLENFVFSWAGRGDVVVITTQPNELNPPHIDCSP